jgi:hypothetical protein
MASMPSDIPSTMRRKFLSTLVLGAGSLVLTACGGGGGGAAASTASSSSKTSPGTSAGSQDATNASMSAASGTPSAASDATPSATPATAATPDNAATTNTAATPQAASDTTPSTNNASQDTSDASNASNPGTSGVLLDTSFGVKGDGTTNDRAALQAAIDGSVGQILLITGQSRIDATGLTLRSNTHIRFAPGASIKLLPHNTDSYQMMRVWDVSDVNIESPYLDGNKQGNAATSGEWGMGISIAGSTNVTITSPTTINCWGDGIYLANSYTTTGLPSKNITVNNHTADGCRRQGVSITSGDTITFNNPVWKNIAGTAPEAGLDIEPDDNNAVLRAIRIVNPKTLGCAGAGIQVYLGSFAGPVAKTVDIQITNHIDNSTTIGPFGVGGLDPSGYSVTGLIKTINPVWKENWYLGDWISSGPTVSVVNPTIS